MTRNRTAAYRLGLDAEASCAAYLQSLGYDILATRLRTREGEIDILARHGDTLVIVEVKARGSTADGLHAVTPRQQRRLWRAALALQAEPDKVAGLAHALPPNIRFDVMAVSGNGPPLHIQDAWREE